LPVSVLAATCASWCAPWQSCPAPATVFAIFAVVQPPGVAKLQAPDAVQNPPTQRVWLKFELTDVTLWRGVKIGALEMRIKL
jgi:hypothetical protein